MRSTLGSMKSRRHLVRLPALALLVLLTAAWVPCFACDGKDHVGAAPGIGARDGCHGAGDFAGSSCGQEIRAQGPALRVVVPPAAVAAPILADSPELLVLETGAPPSEFPGAAPLSRPPLYLLHGILLA
jgi:hypothetical protein